MIFTLPETAKANPPDGKSEDISRRAAPLVDRFAEHLNRPERHRNSDESAASKAPKQKAVGSEKPDPPSKADAKRQRVTDTSAQPLGNGESSAPETDESEKQDNSQTPGAFVATTFANADLPVASALEGAAVTPESDAASDPGRIEIPPSVTSDSTDGVNGLQSERAIDAGAVDGSSLAAEEPSDLQIAAPQTTEPSAQLESGIEEIGQAARDAQLLAPEAKSNIEGANLASEAISAANESTAIQKTAKARAAVPIQATQAIAEDAEVSNDPRPSHLDAIAKALMGGKAAQSGVETNSIDTSMLRSVAEALRESHAANDETEHSDENRTNDATSEKFPEASPILSPSDAAQAVASTLPMALRRHIQSHPSGTSPASTPPTITDAQQARLLQRVARAFRAAEERGGEVQIRLSPPELGSLKLELSLASGVLTAKVEVENQRAQTILLDNLGSLRERLAEQGIRIEKFDVNLPQRDSNGQQPHQQHQQQDGHRHTPADQDRRRPNEAPPIHNDRNASRQVQGDSQLNVIV